MIPATPTTVARPWTVSAARILIFVYAVVIGAFPFVAGRPHISAIFLFPAVMMSWLAWSVGRGLRAAFVLWVLASFMIVLEAMRWYPLAGAHERVASILATDHGPSVVASWVSLVALVAAAVLLVTPSARGYAAAMAQTRDRSALRRTDP